VNRQFLRQSFLVTVSWSVDQSNLREGFALTPMEIDRPASHVYGLGEWVGFVKSASRLLRFASAFGDKPNVLYKTLSEFSVENSAFLWC
jgi:hypothetical protein